MGIVDFHSHLMPAVDDGARDIEGALAALQAFHAQGTTTCLTTPHFDGSLTKRSGLADTRLAEFDAAA